MATQRYISTSFWDDEWVQEHDPSEKLFYLYLLTNPLTNIAGVYQITDRRVAFDTGFNADIVKEMWKRFEAAGKAMRRGEWVVLPSWPKHQKWELRRKIMLGIVSVLQGIPRDVFMWVDECGYQFDLKIVAGTIIASKERQTISGSKRQNLIVNAGGCELCREKKTLVLHHKKPLEDGGSNAEGNIQVLCTVCHGREHSPDTLSSAMWTTIDESRYLTNYLESDLEFDPEKIQRQTRSGPETDSDTKTDPARIWNSDSVHLQIYKAFETEYAAIMPDIAKQIDAINILVTMAEERGNPEQLLPIMMNQLLTLKKGDNGKTGFWRDQPFLPKTLVSLWPQVWEHTKTPEDDYDDFDWEVKDDESKPE